MRALNPRLLGYEPSVLPTELTPQRGGFNHVTTSAKSKRLTKSALYSIASVDTTHKRIGLLWCPSSKAALSNSLSDTLGTEHLCHFRRQCQIRLHIIEPCISTVAGSYSRCIMVIIFGQSVMGVSEGEYDHPRWNCATPATAHYTTLPHRT